MLALMFIQYLSMRTSLPMQWPTRSKWLSDQIMLEPIPNLEELS